ncbi:uncharacterized protein [Drosophila takahashii]|uniref:uncharacterized protein isoform X2 n=1 Tax=Drosophila takahashii TaxID=29030 RepID=UPI003898FBC2
MFIHHSLVQGTFSANFRCEFELNNSPIRSEKNFLDQHTYHTTAQQLLADAIFAGPRRALPPFGNRRFRRTIMFLKDKRPQTGIGRVQADHTDHLRRKCGAAGLRPVDCVQGALIPVYGVGNQEVIEWKEHRGEVIYGGGGNASTDAFLFVRELNELCKDFLQLRNGGDGSFKPTVPKTWNLLLGNDVTKRIKGIAGPELPEKLAAMLLVVQAHMLPTSHLEWAHPIRRWQTMTGTDASPGTAPICHAARPAGLPGTRALGACASCPASPAAVGSRSPSSPVPKSRNLRRRPAKWQPSSSWDPCADLSALCGSAGPVPWSRSSPRGTPPSFAFPPIRKQSKRKVLFQ